MPLQPGPTCAGGGQKHFPARLAEIRTRRADGVQVEVWWQEEAGIGQNNKITRRWAKRGTRPLAAKDQMTTSASLFGALCPKKGKAAALVMPCVNTEAMNAHLPEISRTVQVGAHAVLLLDQAGWHTSSRLQVLATITLLALPPR